MKKGDCPAAARLLETIGQHSTLAPSDAEWLERLAGVLGEEGWYTKAIYLHQLVENSQKANKKRGGMNEIRKTRSIVRRWLCPTGLLMAGTVCGFIPSSADGATLAGVPNIAWIILNICMVCYALGMIHGRLTQNTEETP